MASGNLAGSSMLGSESELAGLCAGRGLGVFFFRFFFTGVASDEVPGASAFGSLLVGGVLTSPGSLESPDSRSLIR